MSQLEHSEHAAALKEAAREAPAAPGVYLFRNGENAIIYVGKARVLRSRLAAYFSGAKDVKTAALIRHSRSLETFIVSNEYEALLLENTLIKQHSPKYNINLKDGKTYPVIRITAEGFPRVFRTRHIVEDGSRYFGPFPNVQAVDKLLELIDKLFPLRKCRILRKRTSPCMYYHIRRCTAPCCGKISPEDYALHVERIRKLLSENAAGHAGEQETGALIMELTEKMHEAAARLQFERAAEFRNAIRAIEEISLPIAVSDGDAGARDYIAWASEGIFTAFAVLSMREGRMTGKDVFSARSAAEEGESVETFITVYYGPGRPPPPVIFLGSGRADPGDGESPPAEIPDSAGLGRWFREQFGHEPALSLGGEKHHAAILAMARQNALEELRRRLRERGAGPGLDELVTALGLRTRPERIEGFDIAQLDGKHPVASLISFKNGVPDRKNYRYFKLRTVVGVVDDFAALREAVRRRYSRLIREGKELPDLVLIDGGVGQVSAAQGVMDELGMRSGLVGLAKREEELWLPQAKAPVILPRRSEALKILQFVRDETHRFATGLNQRLRSRDLAFSALESVEGIGPRRAAALMKAYGGIEGIAAADPAELGERCGIGRAAARAVRAAAKLALEDRRTVTARRAAGGRAGSGASLAAEAAADYGPGEEGR